MNEEEQQFGKPCPRCKSKITMITSTSFTKDYKPIEHQWTCANCMNHWHVKA